MWAGGGGGERGAGVGQWNLTSFETALSTPCSHPTDKFILTYTRTRGWGGVRVGVGEAGELSSKMVGIEIAM